MCEDMMDEFNMWTVCGCIVLLIQCVCVFVGGACVALCLVLTHPAINCVSTAAVCIGQIESSATGPFCFSPLGWASRPPHSHWSQPTFSFFFSILLCAPLSLFFCLSPSQFCFIVLSVSLSWEIDGLVSRTRGKHSFACCSFFGLANKLHMCYLPSPPTFPICLHEKGRRDRDCICICRGGDDFRLLQTSWLWPVLRAGGWLSPPQLQTSILGPCQRVSEGWFHLKWILSISRIMDSINENNGYKTLQPENTNGCEYYYCVY